jgi:Predicted Zn-dependent protease (DUF2268)
MGRRAGAGVATAVGIAAALAVGSRSGDERPAYDLVIRDSAASSARAAGVDLEAILRPAADHVLRRLPDGGRPRIEVRIDASQYVIPEIGFGGRQAGRTAFLHVERPLRDGAATWLPVLAAHELHHVSRSTRGAGYGATLGEALVSEGLADHFAGEAYAEAPPRSWIRPLTPEEERTWWQRARAELGSRAYDHAEWFFGGLEIPESIGYRLGYQIVGAYLEQTGRTAADAFDVDAATVIAAYEE